MITISLGQGELVRYGQVNVRDVARRGDFFKPFQGPAVEFEGRFAARQVSNPHIAPENAL
ncbi:MAG: hypothetical protein R3C42_02905 [Parvularculaceae bacterium]